MASLQYCLELPYCTIGLHPLDSHASSCSASIDGVMFGAFEHTEVAVVVVGWRKEERTAKDSASLVAMERNPWDQPAKVAASMVSAVLLQIRSLFLSRRDRSLRFLASSLLAYPPSDVCHSTSTRS